MALGVTKPDVIVEQHRDDESEDEKEVTQVKNDEEMLQQSEMK